MSDAPRGAVIAIGAAIVALLTSVAAVIVVVARSADATPARVAGTTMSERHVAAADVAKLKRDTVEKVTDKDSKVIGVKVTDDKLRGALGLAADDVITALAGRTIKREFDVYDAVLGTSMMDSSVIYVDLVRDGKPQLVRWQLDGDLRSARRATDVIPPAPVPVPVPPIPSPPTIDPYSPDPSDPADDALIDSVRKIDDNHYEVPRTTVDRVQQNPLAVAKGVRVVPAMRNGKPEGMKLYAIRPTSLWAALGFRNGDTVRAINGVELTSADKALEVYTTLRDATRFEIDLIRRGTPEVLVITVR